MEDNHISIRQRDYARNLQRKLSNDDAADNRYCLLNSFSTDGFRFFRLVVDTTRKKTKKRHPPKLKNIEKNLDEIKAITGGYPLQHFGAIVGIDPGLVYAAGVFSLPTNPSANATQLLIRNKSLYGRQRRNDRWLERRKAMNGIAFLEEDLSKVSAKTFSLKGYKDFVKVWQRENRLAVLRTFYNELPVAHRRLDSKISSKSELDKACELIERLPGTLNSNGRSSGSHRHQEHSRPTIPTLFLIGDGDFGNSRCGLRTSKHSRLLSTLRHRLKHRDPTSSCYGIDEFHTSQFCPRCLSKFCYLRRKPRSQAEGQRKKRGPDGLVDEYRVQHCERYAYLVSYIQFVHFEAYMSTCVIRCGIFMNRDGASAQAFAIIAESLLRGAGRPSCFSRSN